MSHIIMECPVALSLDTHGVFLPAIPLLQSPSFPLLRNALDAKILQTASYVAWTLFKNALSSKTRAALEADAH